jgi:tripartite-type tricarboxylate transporter receptor subunit TctC
MPNNNLSRRILMAVGTSFGISTALPFTSALAQAYPEKPVTVVVPYAAGGGADTLARVIFGKLSEDFGQQFIIENRGGGGGTIGAGAVARADADGYTILYDATAFSINPALFARLPYDPAKDFQPVFLVGTLPLLLLVNPAVEARTVPEVIAIGKSSPEGLDWASAGKGSVQHLALEMFRAMADIPITHIPFKGGAPALTDLVGEHVKYYFSNTAASSSYVQAGSVRAIAHTGRDRLASFPGLLPVADTLPGFEAYEWNGVFVPAGTPPEVIQHLNTGLNAVVHDPAVMERLASLGVQTQPNSPAEFGAFVRSETEKWSKVVRGGNIEPS